MAIQDISTLKSFFENGDQPTQQQFWDLIDSFLHQSTEQHSQDFTGNTVSLNNTAGFYNSTEVLTGEIVITNYSLGGMARFVHKDSVAPSFLNGNRVNIISGDYIVDQYNIIYLTCWDDNSQSIDVIIGSSVSNPLGTSQPIDLEINRISATKYEIISLLGIANVDIEIIDDLNDNQVTTLTNISLPYIYTVTDHYGHGGPVKMRAKSTSSITYNDWVEDWGIELKAQTGKLTGEPNNQYLIPNHVKLSYAPMNQSEVFGWRKLINKGTSWFIRLRTDLSNGRIRYYRGDPAFVSIAGIVLMDARNTSLIELTYPHNPGEYFIGTDLSNSIGAHTGTPVERTNPFEILNPFHTDVFTIYRVELDNHIWKLKNGSGTSIVSSNGKELALVDAIWKRV